MRRHSSIKLVRVLIKCVLHCLFSSSCHAKCKQGNSVSVWTYLQPLAYQYLEWELSHIPILITISISLALSLNGREEIIKDEKNKQQLDNLLIQAFQQPNVQALLLALRGIPGSNPFSTAIDASYSSEVDVGRSSKHYKRVWVVVPVMGVWLL